MGSISGPFQESIQDYVFAGEDLPAAPGSLFLGLHTGDPGSDGTANEVDAADYGRAETGSGDWDRLAGVDPVVVENTSDIEFGIAENEWGNVSHVTIWDSADAGEVYWRGSLSESKQIDSNDEFVVRSGTATLDLG